MFSIGEPVCIRLSRIRATLIGGHKASREPDSSRTLQTSRPQNLLYLLYCTMFRLCSTVGCFVVLLLCALTLAEVFTSVAQLERVLLARESLARAVRSYATAERSRVDALERHGIYCAVLYCTHFIRLLCFSGY